MNSSNNSGKKNVFLPIREVELLKLLDSQTLKQHYTFSIFDFDALIIEEHSNILHINMLAIKWHSMDDIDRKIVSGYCKEKKITDPLKILNICEQINLFTYILVKPSNITDSPISLTEVKELEANSTLKKLDVTDVPSSDGRMIGNNIFLLYGTEPDTTLYNQDEMRKMNEKVSRDNAWIFNKIEEMLEGNYNQIDGVINNTPRNDTHSKLEEIRNYSNEEQSSKSSNERLPVDPCL